MDRFAFVPNDIVTLPGVKQRDRYSGDSKQLQTPFREPVSIGPMVCESGSMIIHVSWLPEQTLNGIDNYGCSVIGPIPPRSASLRRTIDARGPGPRGACFNRSRCERQRLAMPQS